MTALTCCLACYLGRLHLHLLFGPSLTQMCEPHTPTRPQNVRPVTCGAFQPLCECWHSDENKDNSLAHCVIYSGNKG